MESSLALMNSIFHPGSVAFVGVTISDPEHWTRTFLNALLEFKYSPLYLVNPKGGEINGIKVYHSLADIPSKVDYVISTVPAKAAPELIEECADKGVKVVHFCTSGFSETGEEEGIRLEAELKEAARRRGIRVIGPNCMGIYCPDSHISWKVNFPRESGSIGYISQSGGNANVLITAVDWRGVRFSKVVSYGNACDLNESDFLEYLTADPETKIIAMYVEGVRDGARFRRALEKAAKDKPVILLKGGTTEGGARATASHTGSIAGSETTWDALCRQLGVIRVHNLEELANTLVIFQFMFHPGGRRVAFIGGGGGSSVLITDQFEKAGLKVPPLPEELRQKIREFTPVAGNMLRNPIDYSQTVGELDKLAKTLAIVSQWDGIDFLVGFLHMEYALQQGLELTLGIIDTILETARISGKPVAFIFPLEISVEYIEAVLAITQKCVRAGSPVYYTFTDAANALNLALNCWESRDTGSYTG